MPGTTLPQTVDSVFSGHVARTERIERTTIAPSPTPLLIQTFTYPGGLSPDIESPPWYPSRSGKIESVRISLLVTATTDHTIALKINSVQAQQFTLHAGNQTEMTACTIGFGLGDFITVETLTVTDSNLVVEVRVV